MPYAYKPLAVVRRRFEAVNHDDLDNSSEDDTNNPTAPCLADADAGIARPRFCVARRVDGRGAGGAAGIRHG